MRSTDQEKLQSIAVAQHAARARSLLHTHDRTTSAEPSDVRATSYATVDILAGITFGRIRVPEEPRGQVVRRSSWTPPSCRELLITLGKRYAKGAGQGVPRVIVLNDRQPLLRRKRNAGALRAQAASGRRARAGLFA